MEYCKETGCSLMDKCLIWRLEDRFPFCPCHNCLIKVRCHEVCQPRLDLFNGLGVHSYIEVQNEKLVLPKI